MADSRESISLADYWRMFKAKGIRLPFNYFLEVHLFDLLHGTDTRTWLPREQFQGRPSNFEHGTYYMCSWTSAVDRAFRFIRTHLGNQFESFSFVDIGCGKGKVPIAWSLACRRRHLRQRILGIDYYEPFIALAMDNARNANTQHVSFQCADAAAFDYGALGKRLIVYLYNPFDAPMMRRVLAQLEENEVVIAYNNPVHSDVVAGFGYENIAEFCGFHANQHTQIFKKRFLSGGQA